MAVASLRIGCILPLEILREIVQSYIAHWSLLRLSAVCSLWRSILYDAPQWKVAVAVHFPMQPIRLPVVTRDNYVAFVRSRKMSEYANRMCCSGCILMPNAPTV